MVEKRIDLFSDERSEGENNNYYFTMGDEFSLKDTKMDQIRKAFEKTCQNFETARHNNTKLTDVKLVLITEEYYDLAINFAREHFMTQEPIKQSLGMQWTDELNRFWWNTLKLNLSLMYINEKNDEPMAYVATRIARYDDNLKLDLESIQSEPLKELLRYCVYCDERADFFGHFRTKEAFHISGLAVAEKYKQRGLATSIVDTAVDMMLNFGIDTLYVKVEGSSNFSKRVFEKAGFETIHEQPFATWEVDGKFPLQNTGIHQSLKLYGKKLQLES